MQSGCAGDGDSRIEGDGDGDGGTDAVAAIGSGGSDRSNLRGGVEQDGGAVAAVVRQS